MLTEREVVGLLLERGFLSSATIVGGDLAIHDVSRRNQNFLVTTERGPSYLTKHAYGPDGRVSLAREATFYDAVTSLPADRLPGYLPAFHGYYPDEALLVLEMLDTARSLTEHHARGRFSTAVARVLGSALAAVHRGSATDIPAQLPYGLFAHRPYVSWLREMSSANLELVKLIQSAPVLCELLDDVASEWCAECLVHADLKSANCMVVRDQRGRGTSVRLIDWENAGIGDPAWDVGSVFGDYLSSWLNTIPVTGDDPPERFPDLARFPLSRVRPALLSFWEGYVRSMDLGSHTADRTLVRATRYSAVRLVQTANEQTQFATSLTGTPRCLAQVATNILRRPGEAAVRLLEIPLHGRAA